jgi:hypothetical protein
MVKPLFGLKNSSEQATAHTQLVLNTVLVIKERLQQPPKKA